MSDAGELKGIERVVKRFADRLPARLDSIEETASRLTTTEGSNYEDLVRSLHDLAGVAPVVGFPEIGAHARRTEDAMLAVRGQPPAALDDIRAMAFDLRKHAQAAS